MQLLDHPPVNGNLYTALVWTGAEHLFFWRIFAGDGVYMRRIDASGQMVGDNVRLRPYENSFDVAWSDGARLGSVWGTREETGGATRVRSIMFQSFDRLGNALTDPVMIRSSPDINNDGGVSYGPRIASIGEEFVVVWGERTRVFMAKVDPNGHLQGEPLLIAENDIAFSLTLSVVAGNGSVLVGWTRGRPTLSPTGAPGISMVVRAFSSSLAPLGAETVLGQDPSYIGGHQLLSTGDGFVALWGSGLHPDALVQVARLEGAGANFGSNTMGAPVFGRWRHLSPTGWSRDHLVVLWNRDGIDDAGLTLNRFNASGERQGESVDIPLPTGRRTNRLYLTEHDGSIAFSWSEESDDRRYRVYFQRAEFCD